MYMHAMLCSGQVSSTICPLLVRYTHISADLSCLQSGSIPFSTHNYVCGMFVKYLSTQLVRYPHVLSRSSSRCITLHHI